MHSVALKEGEMLFYESARCLHGRISEFKGLYYVSIFVHYQPVDRNIWSYTVEVNDGTGAILMSFKHLTFL